MGKTTLQHKIAAAATEEIINCLCYEIYPGNDPATIEELARNMMEHMGAKSPFAHYGFPYAVSIGRGKVIAHGVPRGEPFEHGEIVRIDFGLSFNGFCGDLATTILVPGGPTNVELMYNDAMIVAQQAAKKAAMHAAAGTRVSELWEIMKKHVNGYDYGLVSNLCGHGIGKEMHQEPIIGPESKYKLRAGQVICIEPFVVLCDPFQAVVEATEDRNGLVIDDMILGVHYEIMVLVTHTCGVIIGGPAYPNLA